MGVRKLFRGLTDKYPFILSNAKETFSVKRATGNRHAASAQHHQASTQKQAEPQAGTNPLSQPNLNGHEFHNLYIDLNGLIHQCYIPFSGKNQKHPLSNKEIFSNVTDSIERLLDIVRPRVLLFIAIDGPAPLAKQQQQRQRRFFQARNERKRRDLYDDLVTEVQERKMGLDVPPYEEMFDSNIISPGTEFMAQLAVYINAHIERKLKSAEWPFRVIFSDSQVPGEGEHKIMRFIRSQKENAGEFYHQNMHHVIYGMDADLVFLTLSLHEPHTTIIRETVSGSGRRHVLDPGLKFKFLHIYTLREYLGRQFAIPNSPFQPNFERMVNDFIFFCSFLGNDFLPKLPTLDIANGALEVLFSLYTQQLQEMNEEGYLVAADSATFVPLAVERFVERITTATEHDYVRKTQRKQASKSLQMKHYEEKKEKKANNQKPRGEPTIKVKEHRESWERNGSARDQKHGAKYERACKHHNTPRGCFRGKACPYVHLDVDRVLDDEAEQVRDQKTAPAAADKDRQGISSTSAQQDKMPMTDEESKPAPAPTAEGSTQDQAEETTPTLESSKTTDSEPDVYPREQEIFVGMLPKSVGDEHLRDIFKDCGKILKAVVVVNPFGNVSKGFGFVTFDSVQGVQKALDMQNKIFVDGRKIIINPALREGDDSKAQKSLAEQYKDFKNELSFRVKRAEKDEIMEYEHPFGEIDQKQNDEALDDWKDRYYKHHCDAIDDSDEGLTNAKRAMVKNYVHGLQFVIQYYLMDIPSWSYFYHYHRSPFASELHSLGELGKEVGQEMEFDTKPFRPLDQLLSILPIDSNAALPEPYRKLQNTILKDYYPLDFPLDLDVKMHWEAHPLLPFMKRDVLEKAIETVPLDAFTEDEQIRNQFHKPTLYVPHGMRPVPFPVDCMDSMESINKNDEYEAYAFELKTPRRIFSSLSPGVLPTTWKTEKKVAFKFRSNFETNDYEMQKMRDQMAKLQMKVQDLRKKLCSETDEM